MSQQFLYEQLDNVSKMGFLDKKIPNFVVENLNPKFELREYQKEAFARFFYCLDGSYDNKEYPLHFLFNMATGSGKTLIMAGLILYLYEKGYRNFIFFTRLGNIIEKTKDNFLNNLSSKFLFNNKILFKNKEIKINLVNNFDNISLDDINIGFYTIGTLHNRLKEQRENTLTSEDFKNKRVALLADEAHNFQVNTKQQRLFEEENWENTVINKIFKQNNDNLLLEFTATMDLANKDVVEKYLNKIIYKYELKEFRNDRFSKDVELLHTDTNRKDRIIQAIILNQYRQGVANKNKIYLKPVILFKAQKTIDQSKDNKRLFHEVIDKLSVADLEKIKKKSDVEILQSAFKFFKENKITSSILIKKLKNNFSENKCLSVNEEKEKEKNQILLNSLEDKNNQIRAIFAVQKLNEGWDVLNLFDIVRLYETRDGRENKPGKTTISEAQLIGRGARYFPFKIKAEDELFKRKYDKNLDNELRILEELHYHSHNESRYISEIKTALINEGMMDKNQEEVDLKIKEDFKKTKFYNNGLVWFNERVIKDFKNVKSIRDLGVKDRNIVFKVFSGMGKETQIFDEIEKNGKQKVVKIKKDISLSNIEEHIIKSALAKNNFFNFSSLKKYYPKLDSIKEFIKNDLNKLNITFEGTRKDLENLDNKNKLLGVLELLNQIEKQIKENLTEFEGTKNFKPAKIKLVFKDKKIKISKDNERLKGQEEFLKNKEWYIFNANYGTSEEKEFVKFIDRGIDELGKNFKKVYLIRNERELKIYNFKDGKAFEPDYLLFLVDKKGNNLTYQLFLEPKGKQLIKLDKWKNEFLEEIKEKFKDKFLEFSKSKRYKIIGVPFYNSETENDFKKKLLDSIK